MELLVLGSIEARSGAARIALSGAKLHTVLASLVLARQSIVPDTRLRALLWDWDPPSTSGAQIYTYVSRIRKQLGSAVDIIREPGGYSLRPASGTRVDVVEFERLTGQGEAQLEAGAHESAASTLRAALRLWRGPALTNATEHLVAAEAAQLEEQRTAVLEGRIEADLALGLHRELVPELTGLVARHPLRERFRVQLMTALYRADRQADAIAAYYEGRRVLSDELGIDPGLALADAYQAIISNTLDQHRATADRAGCSRCAHQRVVRHHVSPPARKHRR